MRPHSRVEARGGRRGRRRQRRREGRRQRSKLGLQQLVPLLRLLAPRLDHEMLMPRACSCTCNCTRRHGRRRTPPVHWVALGSCKTT